MLHNSATAIGSFDMTKPRKPHPVVQAAKTAASELNDLLNAIGLRISLLRHQLEASAAEAEMLRLAALVEKASQRVLRLEEYARAEELVASMRPPRTRKRSEASAPDSPTFLTEKPRTVLVIAEAAGEGNPIKEYLERSGFTVFMAVSSADGLKLLQSHDHFDQIVCDSSFLAETGFSAELQRAVPASRVFVMHRRSSDRPVGSTE
jgi:hypothetical protein